MNPVFPPEIIETTVENHFSRFSKRSQIIYILILLVLCGSTLSLFFIKSDITIQSRGILRSSAESVTLVSPLIAEVKRTILNENLFVSEGDTVIWFESEKLDERIRYNEKLIFENETYINDIYNMLEDEFTNLKTDLFRSAHLHYRQKLSEFELNIRQQEKLYTRARKLFDKKVVPIAELEEKQFALDQVRESRNNFVQSSKNEWEKLAVSYEIENKKLHNDISSLINERKNYVIIAPVSGHITDFSGVKPGSFVTTAETLARISPDGEILAEQLVPPKDIGYLKIGMPVLFQVDAYNYNQWGLATGEVTEISNEVYLVNNQPFFRVRSSLDQSFLALKNGYKGELKKGLTVTARFKVTKRTLAQLLFDKTDDWLNPNIITN